MGWWSSPKTRWQENYQSLKKRTAPGEAGEIELFSAPFSDLAPESHPWVAEADIVQLHWTAGLMDWSRWRQAPRKPLVVTLHDQEPYLGCVHYERDLERMPALREMNQIARNLKAETLQNERIAVAGNSEWNTKAARSSGLFPESASFSTIHYPLDVRSFAPRKSSDARAALGISNDCFLVGFACDKLDNPRKGLEVLFTALDLLPQDVKANTLLLSFGRDPDEDIRASIPIPWVHVGALTSPVVQSAVYSAMDLITIPSHAEAFGQIAIEALACGTPAIATAVGGLPEALFDGDAGVLVQPDDPTALSNAISTLLENPSQRRDLGQVGCERVASRHAPARVAASYKSLYSQLTRN